MEEKREFLFFTTVYVSSFDSDDYFLNPFHKVLERE